MKKIDELLPGTLVKTPDGIGIVVKKGFRETQTNIMEEIFEKVVLVTVDQETKWFHIRDVYPLG